MKKCKCCNSEGIINADGVCYFCLPKYKEFMDELCDLWERLEARFEHAAAMTNEDISHINSRNGL